MVTASGPYMGSVIRGITPNMVVIEAIITGRVRDIVLLLLFFHP